MAAATTAIPLHYLLYRILTQPQLPNNHRTCHKKRKRKTIADLIQLNSSFKIIIQIQSKRSMPMRYYYHIILFGLLSRAIHQKTLLSDAWSPTLRQQKYPNKQSTAITTATRSIIHSPRLIAQITVLKKSNASFLPDIDVSCQRERNPKYSIPLVTEIPDANHTTTKPSTYLIHKGRATDMIKRCVAVEGLSLSTGWTPQASQAFQLAIEAVVRANPILTGKIVEVKSSPWPWDKKELRIIPNAYPPDSHSFVTVVDPPGNMARPGNVARDTGVDAKDFFEYVHSDVAPNLLGMPDFTVDQIKKGSPLFEGMWLKYEA